LNRQPFMKPKRIESLDAFPVLTSPLLKVVVAPMIRSATTHPVAREKASLRGRSRFP
jgi:hypothetical protein